MRLKDAKSKRWGMEEKWATKKNTWRLQGRGSPTFHFGLSGRVWPWFSLPPDHLRGVKPTIAPRAKHRAQEGRDTSQLALVGLRLLLGIGSLVQSNLCIYYFSIPAPPNNTIPAAVIYRVILLRGRGTSKTSWLYGYYMTIILMFKIIVVFASGTAQVNRVTSNGAER